MKTIFLFSQEESLSKLEPKKCLNYFHMNTKNEDVVNSASKEKICMNLCMKLCIHVTIIVKKCLASANLNCWKTTLKCEILNCIIAWSVQAMI